jgi:6-phosphogluconate dehydrogenase
MAAYAEGLNVLQNANAGKQQRTADAETSPLEHPERYQYDFPIGDVVELWRRGSVIGSWLLDLTAIEMARDATLKEYTGRVSDSGEGRWTAQAAIDEGVPVPVLTAALFGRFTSQGNDLYANKVMSAMRHAFGGHKEVNADKKG